MNCENCKDEYCHVCMIGIDHFPQRSGMIFLSGNEEHDRALHMFMNTPLPYGFIPFDNSFEHYLSNCFDKHLSGDESYKKMLDAKAVILLREK